MLTTVIIACVPTLYHIFTGLHSGLTTTQIPDAIGLERPRTKVEPVAFTVTDAVAWMVEDRTVNV